RSESWQAFIRVRHRLEALETGFHAKDKSYLRAAPARTLGDLQALARRENAVLVEFRGTNVGAYVFFLGPGDREVTEEEVLYSSCCSRSVLQEWTDRWGRKYRQWARLRKTSPKRGLEVWMAAVDRMARDLHRSLLGEVQERLNDRYPSTKRLILIPDREL